MVQDSLIEVFSTPKGAVYQCDASQRFVVVFANTESYFSIKQFLDFKKVIGDINLNVMIERLEASFDMELVYLPESNHLYTLQVCEVYYLQEILAGAKTMLALNSLLHELAIGVV